MTGAILALLMPVIYLLNSLFIGASRIPDINHTLGEGPGMPRRNRNHLRRPYPRDQWRWQRARARRWRQLIWGGSQP